MKSLREKTLEGVQRVLAERGYVVIGIKPEHDLRYEIGEIVWEVCAHDLEQPFQIIAKTDFADWQKQCEMAGAPNVPEGHRSGTFYRAITD